MQNFNELFRTRRRQLFRATGFLAIVVAFVLVFGLVFLPWTRAQNQSQSQATSAAPPPAFEYEVASIKPSNPDALGMFMTIPGPEIVSDSFTAKNLTVLALIRSAYGIPFGDDNRISGAPKWISIEKYDVDAKIEASVVDALKKLNPDQRMAAQQHMLQSLLADRFKLTIHRETKDLPMYTLVIAKNGPKLKESKPDDAAPAAPATRGGPGGRGGRGGRGMSIMGRGGPLVGQSVPIKFLVDLLSAILGRPISDKTGLTGTYDFTLQWTPDENQSSPGGAPNGPPPPAPADTTGPSLFTAIQEQLGLKLESGKGPVEIIVIDHVERPSGN